jgi:hypothetical protein
MGFTCGTVASSIPYTLISFTQCNITTTDTSSIIENTNGLGTTELQYLMTRSFLLPANFNSRFNIIANQGLSAFSLTIDQSCLVGATLSIVLSGFLGQCTVGPGANHIVFYPLVLSLNGNNTDCHGDIPGALATALSSAGHTEPTWLNVLTSGMGITTEEDAESASLYTAYMAGETGGTGSTGTGSTGSSTGSSTGGSTGSSTATGNAVDIIYGGLNSPLRIRINHFDTNNYMSTYLGNVDDSNTYVNTFTLNVTLANFIASFNIGIPVTFSNTFLSELDSDDLRMDSTRPSVTTGFLDEDGHNFCESFVISLAKNLLGVSNVNAHKAFDKVSRNKLCSQAASFGAKTYTHMRSKDHVAAAIHEAFCQERGAFSPMVGDILDWAVIGHVSPDQTDSSLSNVIGGASTIIPYVSRFRLLITSDVPRVHINPGVYSALTHSTDLPTGLYTTAPTDTQTYTTENASTSTSIIYGLINNS